MLSTILLMLLAFVGGYIVGGGVTAARLIRDVARSQVFEETSRTLEIFDGFVERKVLDYRSRNLPAE
jgi:hypothetical protein